MMKSSLECETHKLGECDGTGPSCCVRRIQRPCSCVHGTDDAGKRVVVTYNPRCPAHGQVCEEKSMPKIDEKSFHPALGPGDAGYDNRVARKRAASRAGDLKMLSSFLLVAALGLMLVPGRWALFVLGLAVYVRVVAADLAAFAAR